MVPSYVLKAHLGTLMNGEDSCRRDGLASSAAPLSAAEPGKRESGEGTGKKGKGRGLRHGLRGE